MVNVSKQKLKEKVRESIISQLVHHVARLHGDTTAKNFLSELLSEAEEIQLAKRFSAVVLLTRGYSFRQVQQILKISPTTAVKLWQQYTSGKFKTLKSVAIRRGKAFQKDSAIDSLIALLAEGFPPRAGRGVGSS